MKKALTIDRKRQGHFLGLTKQPEKRHFCLLPLNSLRLSSSCILLFLLAISPSLSYAYAYSSIATGSWNSSKLGRGEIMLKSHIKDEDIVNIRHNIVYNLPKGLIVNERVNSQEGVSCKNSTGKILPCNFIVKNNYPQNKSTKVLQKQASLAVGDTCNTVRWHDGGPNPGQFVGLMISMVQMEELFDVETPLTTNLELMAIQPNTHVICLQLYAAQQLLPQPNNYRNNPNMNQYIPTPL